jgi:hypothetical protein
MASARKKSNSKSRSAPRGVASARTSRLTTDRHIEPGKRFAVCVRNDGYKASLELRKIYEVLDDTFGQEHELVRVIDESGEDYLYPAEYFVRLELPASLQQKLRRIA